MRSGRQVLHEQIMKMRRLVIILLIVACVYALLWFGLANPFNLFVPRSKHFSFSRFRTIKPGAPIEGAIKLLGEPVKVVKENRFDPDCPTCIAYCFMGEPPNWVFGFQEAWLIADRQGKIVQVFVNTEP
jgi:hypothetical protein